MKSLKNNHHRLLKLIVVLFAVIDETFLLNLCIFCKVPSTLKLPLVKGVKSWGIYE